jgi:hypothetical protein
VAYFISFNDLVRLERLRKTITFGLPSDFRTGDLTMNDRNVAATLHDVSKARCRGMIMNFAGP